jgi:hypothetical protein
MLAMMWQVAMQQHWQLEMLQSAVLMHLVLL